MRSLIWTVLFGVAVALGSAYAEELSEAQKRTIDATIAERGLNRYGDPRGTMYMGGTPLFDERTGQTRDRWEFLADKHPELVREATKAPTPQRSTWTPISTTRRAGMPK